MNNQRALAAWRARACAAAVACGAQIFCLGAGIAVPLGLNAAWLCALPAVMLAALLAARARGVRASLGAGGNMERLRALLLCAVMLFSCLLLLAACVSLCTQTLLSHARVIHCAALTLLFILLAAIPRMEGVCRLCFALRLFLPAGLLLCMLTLLPRGAVSGLFPLLGTGAGPVSLGALCMLPAAAPALMLLLPGGEKDAGMLPRPGFFALRAGLGALCGAGLLLLPALFSGYEALRTQSVWGARLRMSAVGGGQKPLWHMALLLTQFAAMTLGACALLCAAEEAVFLAFPRLRRRRSGLLILAALLMAGLRLFSGIGYETAMYAAPLIALPVPLLLLPAGKRQRKAADR